MCTTQKKPSQAQPRRHGDKTHSFAVSVVADPSDYVCKTAAAYRPEGSIDASIIPTVLFPVKFRYCSELTKATNFYESRESVTGGMLYY
jgi:hypothetical protein